MGCGKHKLQFKLKEKNKKKQSSFMGSVGHTFDWNVRKPMVVQKSIFKYCQ